MTLEELKQRLEDGCRKLNFPEPINIKRGFSFAKFELRIAVETSIEIYFNEETQSLTSALIDRGKRVFGIDEYPASGVCHLHPLGKVAQHLNVGPMQIEEILEQYAKALHELELDKRG